MHSVPPFRCEGERLGSCLVKRRLSAKSATRAHQPPTENPLRPLSDRKIVTDLADQQLRGGSVSETLSTPLRKGELVRPVMASIEPRSPSAAAGTRRLKPAKKPSPLNGRRLTDLLLDVLRAAEEPLDMEGDQFRPAGRHQPLIDRRQVTQRALDGKLGRAGQHGHDGYSLQGSPQFG